MELEPKPDSAPAADTENAPPLSRSGTPLFRESGEPYTRMPRFSSAGSNRWKYWAAAVLSALMALLAFYKTRSPHASAPAALSFPAGHR